MRPLRGLVLAAGLLSCQAITDPPLGVCGNRVVEAGEDCDDPDDPACGSVKVAAACRFLCDDTGCASGRSCGDDGVCRTPTGSFAAEAMVIEEAGARAIEVGDLDGDGRDDLIVPTVEVDSRDVKAIFVEVGADPVIVTLQESIVETVAVGDLSGDGRADVLMVPESGPTPAPGAATRLSLWTGQADRSFALSHFATLRSSGSGGRLLAPTTAPDRVLELVTPTLTRWWSSQEVVAVDVPAIGAGGPGLGVAIAVRDLDGGSCVSELGSVVVSPEVAFATAGEDAVRVVSSCGGGGSFTPRAPVRLPQGRRLGGGGAFFAIGDLDERVDLLAQDDAGAVWLAHGVGDGSFHGSAAVPASDGDDQFDVVPFLPAIKGAGDLLAAADYDDDGRLELVTRAAYLPAPELCTVDACEQRPWPESLVHAVTVDINRDGALDVATAEDDTLTIFLGGPVNPQDFEAHAIEFRGPVGEIVVGDLNRDTIEDIAFTEVDEDISDGAGQWIVVLYGGNAGSWTFERFGPFVGIEALVVERGVTMVVRVADAQERPAGAFIRPGFGEHDFGLVARTPVLVRTDPSLAPGLGAVALGVSSGETREALVHFGFASGILSPHDVIAGDALELGPGGGVDALTLAIDGDGDGVDELLVFGRGVGGAGQVWLARLDRGAQRWGIDATFEHGPGFARQANDRFALPGPPGGGPGSDAAVGDVDGDGDVDVLVTTDAPQPAVVVLRNDGGSFSSGGALTLAGPAEFQVARIEAWHADAAGVARWLVAGADGVGVAQIDLDAATITVERRFEEPTRVLAAVDVDGDGLRDLVYATDEEIVVRLAEEQIGAGDAV